MNENVVKIVSEELKKGNYEIYYGNVLRVDSFGPVGFMDFKKVDTYFIYFMFANMICHQGIFARRDNL